MYRSRGLTVTDDFERLAAAHKDAVYRQLIRTCGNQEDAEDVLVEALLKAYQHLDQLREHGAFRAWLAQIGRRVCWQMKRRESLSPVIHLAEAESRGQELVDTGPSPEVAVARQRLQALLREAVDHLDPASRAVYVLRDLEERSGAEVAQQLGISLAAEKSRLHRARAQVRDFLDRRLAGEAPVTPPA
ncbi:MAG: RNA polymerase sigma factor [Vicinamibacterales bacterium]